MYNIKKINAIASTLDNFQKICAITVTLRILDGSCKMSVHDKNAFLALYNALSDKQTDFFDDNISKLILLASKTKSQSVYTQIEELRKSAMSMITLPRMKAFKDEFRKQVSE